MNKMLHYLRMSLAGIAFIIATICFVWTLIVMLIHCWPLHIIMIASWLCGLYLYNKAKDGTQKITENSW